MTRILYILPGQEDLGRALAEQAGLETGRYELRRFPDGESYLRVLDTVQDRDVIILCQLHHPDTATLPMILLAETLRDLGARRVGLVAPYLAYMRQDRRFHSGEGVTARYFASLLSRHVDWLLTVDPHLHRIHDLEEVYTIPARALTAVEPIAVWLRAHVENPLIIGPDSESSQWAGRVAEAVGCPVEILQKRRLGDRDVEVSLPHVTRHTDRTPVLVDDMISTGRTLQQAAAHLRAAGFRRVIAVAVHGLFSEGARQELAESGLEIVTSNSIPGPDSQVDLAPLLAKALQNVN